MRDQKAAVDSGQWLLYRYNPTRATHGENPFILDSQKPKLPVEAYLNMENRFKMLSLSNPTAAHELFAEAQEDVTAKYAFYEYLATRPMAALSNGEEL